MPFKKVFKKARKTVKKLIPKEIRPFVPYIAAGLVPPGAVGLGGISNTALQKAIIAGGARFATDDEADLKDVGITAALAATPDLLEQVGSSGQQTEGIMGAIRRGAETGAEFAKDKPLTTMGIQAGVDAANQLAEINEDALDEYNRKLAEQGITDKRERRARIRDIYLGVGYDEDYVDGLLDRYGYKSGGVTYTMDEILDMATDLTKKKRKDREEEDEDELGYFLEQGQKGLMSLMPKQKPVPIRPLQMAEGGMMNLGGNEMDLRGGGFVPIGKKEKADDVPARLSKNEFVMTADAVRGAGGGDVNEGAKRMYQTMDRLEAMA
jgi:hypothetical protein